MKKNLLRGTALTAAALFALSLTACGPAGDGDDASPLATQESASDAHMAQSTDPLQMLSHGSDDGFYLSLMDMTRGSEDRTELMGYIDYAQARAAVLCAQPNCTHSDESCPAWRGIWGGSAWVLPDGEHIVTNTGDEDSYTLTLCKPDGTVEKTLCRTADNNVPTLADSTWLYCVVAPGGSIVRVPLAGGDPEPLTSLNAYDVEGCLGREVLYPSYGSEEQADGTSRSTLKYTACNIDTGATRTLLEVSYPSGVISNPYLGGDTLYWYDPQGDTLVQVDVRTGSETRMPLEWEFGRGGCGEIYQTTISAQVEGKLIVDQYGEDTAPWGRWTSRRCAWLSSPRRISSPTSPTTGTSPRWRALTANLSADRRRERSFNHEKDPSPSGWFDRRPVGPLSGGLRPRRPHRDLP